MKRPKILLEHIMDEIGYLLQNSKDLNYEELINNETLKRSFVRSLEIIGEAAKNLPDDFRNKFPEIEWKKIIRLRDILIHQYFGINYKTVWDVVKDEMPKLKEQIKGILAKEEFSREE